MRFLHGTDLIGEEIFKIFGTSQILSSFSQTIRNKKLKKYIDARLSFKSSNIKRIKSHLVGIRTFNTTKSID